MRSVRLFVRQAMVAAIAATSVLVLAPTPGHASPAPPKATGIARYSVPVHAERSLNSAVVGHIVAGNEYDVSSTERGETFPDGYCGTTVAFNNIWRVVYPVRGGAFGWTSIYCIN
ncbi:hypothetical protein [Streptomyces chrestomyceticus]|uniref:hypothetical protein n=1 Tax=Streptomyces chrestomyceticus TaxID=68185 RepID=UPI0019D01138|nr:hypothetical protein [Streptomyces chrestomyceticus]